MIKWIISRVGPPMILPSLLVSNNARHWLETKKNIFFKKNSELVEPFRINSSKGACIEGVCLYNPLITKTPPCDQRWIFWCCGNGEHYEELLEFGQKYSQEVGTHILLFNYRGIGASSGYPRVSQDLVDDGVACFKFLINKGIDPKNILIHGRSLGGGTGIQVRSYWPEGPFLSERSFTSASMMAQETYGSLFKRLVFLGNWEFDSVKAWKKITGTKIVIYHQGDLIIPYNHRCALAHVLLKKNDPSCFLELRSSWIRVHDSNKGSSLIEESEIHKDPKKWVTIGKEEPHNQSLDLDPVEWKQIVDAAKKALNL
jgi:hypothetical protein